MPKSAIAGRGSRTQPRPRSAELLNIVEGQVSEICRDLAVHAKRIGQLQEQAEELRAVVRQWADGDRRGLSRGSPSREGRR